MPRKTIHVTEAELSVLEVLWCEKSATIRQVTKAIYRRGTTAEYATVQKLLDRLETKGYVLRNKESFAHTFTTTISRSDLIGGSLQDLAERLCDGSLTPLLVHLTGNAKLSVADRKMLRRMIDES